MFLMALGIRGTFGFADYESRGGGLQIQIDILVALLIYCQYILKLLSFTNIIN